MAYVYPVDIDDLVSRVKRRGESVVRFVGIEDGMRDDLKLTQIVLEPQMGLCSPRSSTFSRGLGDVKEFQDIQLTRAWEKYGGMAMSDTAWLRNACKQKYPTLVEKIELRTFAAIFDLEVQQGGLGKARGAIKSNIVSGNYASQKEIAEMAVRERAMRRDKTWQNNCVSRRLGFLNAQATLSGDLGGKKYTIQNCNYQLLKGNPYVQSV